MAVAVIRHDCGRFGTLFCGPSTAFYRDLPDPPDRGIGHLRVRSLTYSERGGSVNNAKSTQLRLYWLPLDQLPAAVHVRIAFYGDDRQILDRNRLSRPNKDRKGRCKESGCPMKMKPLRLTIQKAKCVSYITFIRPRASFSHSLVLTSRLLSSSHDHEDLAIVRSFWTFSSNETGSRDGLNML